MSGLYDEIVVNEIKLENEANDLVAAQEQASPAKRPGLDGGRQRRRSLSDMFDVVPVATIEEQKSAFESLGQKMYDAQQRGIKGAPKKVQVGVTGMGLTIFDLKSTFSVSRLFPARTCTCLTPVYSRRLARPTGSECPLTDDGEVEH